MKKLAAFLISLLCTLYSVLPCYAANRFWIAGSTDNWNSSANWSTTSGGSGGASVPGSSDVAKFDGNGTGNCTINATVNVAGMDIASGYTGTISQGSNAVTIGLSHYVQAGGTFTGGSATLDVNGTFTLSGGTFTATSTDFYIGSGNFSTVTIFTHSGGTFNHNNGNIIFDPSNGYPSTVDIITSTLFYDIKLNTAGGTQIISVATGDTVKAANNLEFSCGMLYGSCWSFEGNFTVGGNANGGPGQIIFKGSNNQTYSYGSSGRACRLVVNKPSGTVSAASGTTAFATQSFSLLAGTFTAPSADFSVGYGEISPVTIFNHSGGTYNHNNGRIIFNPGNNYTSTIDVITSTLFYNAKLNTAGGNQVLNVAANDTVKVANDLDHNSCYLSGNFWSLQGNLTVGSNATGGANVQVIFTGTNNQTYTYGSAAHRYYYN